MSNNLSASSNISIPTVERSTEPSRVMPPKRSGLANKISTFEKSVPEAVAFDNTLARKPSPGSKGANTRPVWELNSFVGLIITAAIPGPGPLVESFSSSGSFDSLAFLRRD